MTQPSEIFSCQRGSPSGVRDMCIYIKDAEKQDDKIDAESEADLKELEKLEKLDKLEKDTEDTI